MYVLKTINTYRTSIGDFRITITVHTHGVATVRCAGEFKYLHLFRQVVNPLPVAGPKDGNA